MPFPSLSPLPVELLYAPLRAELTAESFMLWKHLKLRACGSRAQGRTDKSLCIGRDALPVGFLRGKEGKSRRGLRCSQPKSGAGPGCGGEDDTSRVRQTAQGGPVVRHGPALWA